MLGGLPDEAYGLGTRGQVSHSQASRCTREFPGGLRRTRSLPGKVSTRGALGDRWHAPKVGPKGGFEMACSEGGFRDKCRTPKVSEGCSDGASKGASGRASGRLRRVYRSGASGIRVTLRKAPKGSFGVARSEGVFEGVFREGLRKRLRRGSSRGRCKGVFRRGFHRGRLWSLD